MAQDLQKTFLNLRFDERADDCQTILEYVKQINDGTINLDDWYMSQNTVDSRDLNENRMVELFNDHTKDFIARNVKLLLERLYTDMKQARVSKVAVMLYSEDDKNFELLGPVGERPIHVCALLAARYRGELGGKERFIAEGIVQGMQEFIAEDNPAGDRKSELYKAYGKDYCAAVVDCIKRGKKDDSEVSIPFFRVLKEWRSHLNRSQANDRHTQNILENGLYEGETVLFPFIASRDEGAVKWILQHEGRSWYAMQLSFVLVRLLSFEQQVRQCNRQLFQACIQAMADYLLRFSRLEMVFELQRSGKQSVRKFEGFLLWF